MQRHRTMLFGLIIATSGVFMGNAFASQPLRADESLFPAAGFHTFDGRIGHPLSSLSSSDVVAISKRGSGTTFNTLTKWGGYIVADTAHTESSAFGYFNIPSTVSCNSTNNLFAPWVGLDGGLYPSGAGVDQYVEQAGVAISCNTGQPSYQAWYEMYPANPVYISTSSYPIHAGDVIGVDVNNNSAGTSATIGSYTIDVCDFGAGGWTKEGASQANWCFQTTQSGGPVNSLSAEAVVESPPSSYPNFSQVTFGNLGGYSGPDDCDNLFYPSGSTQTGNDVACKAGTGGAPTLTAYNAGYSGYTEASTGAVSYLATNLPTLIYNNITFNESFVNP